jgi:hypothetical protein
VIRPRFPPFGLGRGGAKQREKRQITTHYEDPEQFPVNRLAKA